MKQQRGFTLIELVMVIVILGILAAFALPRFADLGSEARIASLQGAVGAVKSASAISHSAWLATGETSPVDLDNTNVTMSGEGYPTADDAGIGEASQIIDDFDIGAIAGDVTTISAVDADGAAIANCSFDYDQSDGGVANEVVTDC